MTNYTGQIFKDMNIEAPAGTVIFNADNNQPVLLAQVSAFYTLGNNRLGIARYRINFVDTSNKRYYSFGYKMSKEGWTLLDEPYTPEMIKAKYGYDVAPDGTRLKKYKLTGRVRALKIMKELRAAGRATEADLVQRELAEAMSQGKRYWLPRSRFF